MEMALPPPPPLLLVIAVVVGMTDGIGGRGGKGGVVMWRLR